MEQQSAAALLQGLVAIPSLSTQEAAAAAWLVEQMAASGYDRAYVDPAGNAVGEMGPPTATQVVVLLGHIDTVPGNIPVRVEAGEDGPLLYGRGSVDAKGPLATATAAVARIGSAWAHAHNLRLVVVGAVEEEAASSKGARWIRDRFDGVREPVPAACIIGEPSGWARVTLGYKGRVLVELDASQPMAHTAGPDLGVATVAVDFWNWLDAYAARRNEGRDKTFDQFSASLRRLHTSTDEAMHDHVTAQAGIRLPLDFNATSLPTRSSPGPKNAPASKSARRRGQPSCRSRTPTSSSPGISPRSGCSCAPTNSPSAATATMRSCARSLVPCAPSTPPPSPVFSSRAAPAT